ncbi:MAG: GxxExxY protein [Candidatus Sumerlaeaceae bacterium]|nr:GxxExxY protein [Candidatus Sumerlaeaceae bacterium]
MAKHDTETQRQREARREINMVDDPLTQRIINCAIEVHRTLGGPGLLESVYEEALVWELTRAGLRVEQQKPLPINYKGHALSSALRVDLIVEGQVIVECKAVVDHNPIFEAQLLTYLRLTGLKVGLVLNFGKSTLREGIHRVSNGF